MRDRLFLRSLSNSKTDNKNEMNFEVLKDITVLSLTAK